MNVTAARTPEISRAGSFRSPPPGSQRQSRALASEKDAMNGDDHAVWDRAIGVNLTSAYDMAVAFADPCRRGRLGARTRRGSC